SGECRGGCRGGAAGGDAAVDDEVLAGDEGGGVARKQQRERRDVVGPSGTPDRLVRLEAFGEYRLEFLGLAVGLCRVDAGTFGEDPGEDRPGRDAVDAHAVLAQLGSDAAGEVDDGRFSGRVVEEGPSRDMPADAGGVDDASPAPPPPDRGGVLPAGAGAAHMRPRLGGGPL